MFLLCWLLFDSSSIFLPCMSTSQIYPTVAELAGLPVPPIGCPGCVEGDSAAPLLEEPHQSWKRASFSQYARCANDATQATGYYQRCSGQARSTLSAMGYSVRTLTWRYTGEVVPPNGVDRAAISRTHTCNLSTVVLSRSMCCCVFDTRVVRVQRHVPVA